MGGVIVPTRFSTQEIGASQSTDGAKEGMERGAILSGCHYRVPVITIADGEETTAQRAGKFGRAASAYTSDLVQQLRLPMNKSTYKKRF